MKIIAIILTYNEEIHIERCIKSISELVDKILICDSFSSDNTLEISKSFDKVDVIQNQFLNYSNQFNYALGHIQDKESYIFRIDADEIIDSELFNEIKKLKQMKRKLDAYNIRRKIAFQGELTKYGHSGDIHVVRLFKKRVGHCELRFMDEHIIVEGSVGTIENGSIIDLNLKNLKWWLEKHVWYSLREAIDFLNNKHGFAVSQKTNKENLDERNLNKRKSKTNIYYRFPKIIRALLLFLFIWYFLKGNKDKGKGKYYHLYITLFYRMLVDLNISYLESAIDFDSTESHIITQLEKITSFKAKL